MIVSEKRIEANRKNAQKSTGPKTDEGKEQSRQNALKHGLTALVVVSEDAETMQEEAEACFWSLRPTNKFQAEIVDQVALIHIRTRRAQRIERKLRDVAAYRACTAWDQDRAQEAERVGRDLAIRPSEVVAELRRTPQGCDWMITRWSSLAQLADDGDHWPGDRGRLAFDLLGTPPELRVGDPNRTSDRADFARAQVASLREYRDRSTDHDMIARELAQADLVDESTPEARRVRRYETALHKRLRWCVATLKDPVPENRPLFDLIPNYTSKTTADESAELEAETQARADKEARFAAEYYAARTEKEAQARRKEEARLEARRKAQERKAAKAQAPAPEETLAKKPNEPIASPEAQSDPPTEVISVLDVPETESSPNTFEPITKTQNEPIARPEDQAPEPTALESPSAPETPPKPIFQPESPQSPSLPPARMVPPDLAEDSEERVGSESFSDGVLPGFPPSARFPSRT